MYTPAQQSYSEPPIGIRPKLSADERKLVDRIENVSRSQPKKPILWRALASSPLLLY